MKKVIITGASRGIGRAAAEVFLENNWQVFGTSTTGDFDFSHENLIEGKLDLSNDRSIEYFVQDIKIKSVDVLINNAGISLDFYEDRVQLNLLRKTVEINVIGTIDLTEQLLNRELLKKGSKILNISSQSGSITKKTGGFMPAYKISKVALNMYTRTLAKTLMDKEISVYSVDPGWVRTDMGGDEAPKSPEVAGKEIFDLAVSNKPTDTFYLEGEARDW